jgi:hypothetical protein
MQGWDSGWAGEVMAKVLRVISKRKSRVKPLFGAISEHFCSFIAQSAIFGTSQDGVQPLKFRPIQVLYRLSND